MFKIYKKFAMKKFLSVFLAASVLSVLATAPALASVYVEFNSKTAQFVSPSQKDIKPKTAPQIKKDQAPITPIQPAVNEDYIKNLVFSIIQDMLANGLLKQQQPAQTPQPPVVYIQPTSNIVTSPATMTVTDDGDTSMKISDFSAETVSSEETNVTKLTVNSEAQINNATVFSLELGSADNPIGITLYDRVTGQPVCLYSENNVIKLETGKCEAGIITQKQPEQVLKDGPETDTVLETKSEQDPVLSEPSPENPPSAQAEETSNNKEQNPAEETPTQP